MIPKRTVRVEVGVAGLPGLSWTDPVQISFKVQRKSGKSANNATVDLWNLSDASLAALEIPDLVLRVYAGTLVPGLVYQGEIDRRGVQTKLAVPDRVTSIESGDGKIALRESPVSISLPPGSSSAQVFPFIFAALGGRGIVPGYVDPTLIPTVYPNGFAFVGRARDALTEVVSDLGADWTIQDQVLSIYRLGTTPPGAAVVVNPLTGLRGSPTRTDKGVAFETTLTPALRPGSAVSLQSIRTTGFYRITDVTHSGASDGSEWSTKAEAVPL